VSLTVLKRLVFSRKYDTLGEAQAEAERLRDVFLGSITS
jgi:hypothetical protein